MAGNEEDAGCFLINQVPFAGGALDFLLTNPQTGQYDSF
jgi:hypothetical protein